MSELPENLKQPLVELLLSLADDKFMLGHRNADWTGLAPILEEDIAFSSMSQDELAHATELYGLVAKLTADDANRLAYDREPRTYRCSAIVELRDDFDWAVALARKWFCDHFDMLRLGRLERSAHELLAAMGRRMLAEERVHVEHCDMWMRRLGASAGEAHDRIQAACDKLAHDAAMLFEPTEGVDQLEAAGIYPHCEGDMFARWEQALRAIAEPAGVRLSLRRPAAGDKGGRRGQHCPGFDGMLNELCEVYRIEPQAAW